MSELTDDDAELAFKYLPETVRADIEYEAHQLVLDAWSTRQADLDKLETANDDDSSPFNWADIGLGWEPSQVDGSDELTPHTGTGDAGKEVHELAREFGWNYVEAIRDEVRNYQSMTTLSPREFVAFVLSQSHLTYDEAASEMGISSGTFASKMSREVNPEIEAAKKTVRLVSNFETDP